MSESKSRRPAVIVAKTRDAAVSVIPRTKQAGASAAHGVRNGVRGVRGWAAPRFEGAANVVDTTVAPKVSGAFRATARKVRPGDSDPLWRRGMSTMMSWRGVTAMVAVLTAAGATVAMTMRRKYSNATAEAKEGAEAARRQAMDQRQAASQQDKAGLDGTRSEEERKVPVTGW